MKAQFKYALITGLFFRGPAFAVIFMMNAVFSILAAFDLLPFAAHVTAVSLGGVAIVFMLTANIIGDIAIGRRMFLMPDAYLHALTPVPRWKTLFASVITMTAMDLLTMFYVIFTETYLSITLGGGRGLWSTILLHVRENPDETALVISFAVLLIAAYILTLMIIMFCITAKKSFLYKKPASGFLAFLLACGCFYVSSLLQLLSAPFSIVERYLFMIIITPASGIAIPFLIVLTLLEAAGLFILTSKLMERKINL